MYQENLTLIVDQNHPAYQWAKRQSDSVGALGHIGTHIDCYQAQPSKSNYHVQTVTIDCTTGMPTMDDIVALNLSGKALILFTGNLVKNGYGTPQYGSTDTCLSSELLDCILLSSPLFIVIDSYGIGAHGEEHISFDKRCESMGCFVIENVNLSQRVAQFVQALNISFDNSSASTGRRCQVTALWQ